VTPQVGCPIKSVGNDWKTLDTALIAFKTPINSKHDHILNAKDRFNVKHLMDELKHMKVKIKHVIDLTEKNVYYQESNFRTEKVQYHKMGISGKKTPTKSECRKFCDLIEELAPNLKGDEYIGVHCTGGKNRTGFLICFYLLWKFPHLQVRHALADFEEARGFGIDKPALIDALHDYFVPEPRKGKKQ